MSASAAAGSDPIVELCAFRVGDEEYVVDIRRIREIVQPLPVVAVPRAPEWMDGVVNLRGEVIPLVDVRTRLGLPPVLPNRRTKILVVHVDGRVLALLVDGVSEVVRIPRSAIGPPPAMGASGARLFLGVCGAQPAAGKPAGKGAPRPSSKASPRAPSKVSAPAPKGREEARGRGAGPQRLRLLLNVRALLEGPPLARVTAPGEGEGG